MNQAADRNMCPASSKIVGRTAMHVRMAKSFYAAVQLDNTRPTVLWVLSRLCMSDMQGALHERQDASQCAICPQSRSWAAPRHKLVWERVTALFDTCQWQLTSCSWQGRELRDLAYQQAPLALSPSQ